MARTISSCLRSIWLSLGAGPIVGPYAARSEINKIDSSYLIRLWFPGLVAAQRPDPMRKFREVGQGPLAARVGAGDLDVHIKGVFPGLSPEGPGFELGQVDVAEGES